MMERWNKTMENINDYSKKQADMCIDNDSIPKALSSSSFVMDTK